jgi:hypothetical protein
MKKTMMTTMSAPSNRPEGENSRTTTTQGHQIEQLLLQK